MSEQTPASVAQQPPQNPILAGFSRFKDVFNNMLKERKPWSEMFDRTAFSKPANLGEATTRLRKNAAYFRVNYALFVLATTVTCMLLNPASLLVLAFLALLWGYLFGWRTAPIVIGGRTFSERENFVGVSIVSGVIIFFLTSVGTILFTALGISCAVISLHGALRMPDDLFTDEAEAQPGLLGFFTAPTSSMGSASNLV